MLQLPRFFSFSMRGGMAFGLHRRVLEKLFLPNNTCPGSSVIIVSPLPVLTGTCRSLWVARINNRHHSFHSGSLWNTADSSTFLQRGIHPRSIHFACWPSWMVRQHHGYNGIHKDGSPCPGGPFIFPLFPTTAASVNQDNLLNNEYKPRVKGH